MRRSPILCVLLAAWLASCTYTSRVVVPLRATPERPRADACVASCKALPRGTYDCLRRCPGAQVADGECETRAVPAGAVCAQEQKTSVASIVVPIVVLVVVGAVVGVAAALGGGGSSSGGGGSGSCPYVYLWDGRDYRYYSDLSGSVLAKGIGFFKSAYYGENIYELGGFAPHQGVYRMLLREVIYEASYFDAAELIVVDVPAGYGVYNQWSFTSQLDRQPDRGFMTVRDPRPPIRATNDRGDDVLAQVSHADGVPLPVERDQLSRVVVDFGPTQHPEHAKLLISAWGGYLDLRRHQRPPYSAGTTIETVDDRGEWKVRVVGGKAAGDARTWVVDLSGVVKAGDTRMRITMAHLPSVLDVLDAVTLDDSPPVATRITRISPRLADLRFGGAARVQPSTLRSRVRADGSRLPAIPDALLRGWYTRYGDVRPLLTAADDRFVVMSNGDELALEFDAPPQAPGTARRAFLSADVFYSLRYHSFGKVTDTVAPLPFHGMQRYPYPAEAWPYRDDAAYERYLKEWNTRRVGPRPVFPAPDRSSVRE